MSAENAWRIAVEAAASTYRGDGEWDTFGEFERTLLALPMPPAFRAEVEAEAEELRGMLARMVDHADAFDHGEAMLSYGGDVAEARALLSRPESKGESHE